MHSRQTPHESATEKVILSPSLMSEDQGDGLKALAMEGVQVAAADGCHLQPHKQLALCELVRQGNLLDLERPALAVEDRRPCMVRAETP